MRNDTLKISAIATAAALVGMTIGAGMFEAREAAAQGAPAPATVSTPVRSTLPAVAGSLQVTRLTDTTFVVVKDEGDAAVVTLFSTEGGLVNKKHGGRFFY